MSGIPAAASIAAPAPSPTPAPAPAPVSIQKAVEDRKSEIEDRKAAAAGREEFMRDVSSQLDDARRAAPKKIQSQLLIDRGPKPVDPFVDPFTEPSETELLGAAEQRVAARDRRKATLEKFRGVLASAFGRQPAPTATNTTTPPTNGAR